MRKLLAAVVIVLALGALGASVYYVYSTHKDLLSNFSLSNLSFSAPCAKPIPYTVGSVDSRFGLSKSEIVADLAKSSGLWNAAAGKSLLVYAPNDPSAMPVNFVYDTREEAVALGSKIDSTEATQNTERSQLDAEQAQYVAAQQAYASAVAAFNAASEQYASEVRQVNNSGGADPATYARLNAEQARLKQQQQDLETRGQALDQQGTQLQAKIDAYNASVSSINQIVSAFNKNAGGDFEEGQYVRTASGAQHIDIYAYKNQSELLHSLAHELGHAIGLGHNQNPVSIMFPYTTTSTSLSTDDVDALKTVCHLQ